MSFGIFLVTYRVTNFLPKLINMLLFSIEKTEFPFFVFPYFWVLPLWCLFWAVLRKGALFS